MSAAAAPGTGGPTPDGRSELIATKLQPPSPPPHLVARPRLDDVFDAALAARRRLVLVTAPAGSGKSTALAGWVASRAGPTAWLQVEESDGDPARFWSYLVSAITRVAPAVGPAVQPRVSARGGDAASVVPALVNALAAVAARLVVVVDDYHLVDNAEVHVGVDRLVELCPEQVTLVLASRTRPPLRLARHRVRGRMAELQAADLDFRPGEASELLGARLDPRLVAQLCQRTEGWAAGLVLAGLSLPAAGDLDAFVAGFGGDDELVASYLVDELLASLPPSDRARLLETSMLERLSGPLVDAVAGGGDGDAWLRRLSSTNHLVIGLDRSGTWFRLHHLLRDLLRSEAARAMPARLPGLHLAASRWHQRHGDIEAAIDHSIAAGELDQAADLLYVHATNLLNGGQIFTVLAQLERLGDLPERHCGASLVRGWTDLVTGRLQSAERWWATAQRLDVDRAEGLVDALGIMVHIARGDVGAGVALADRARSPDESTQSIALAGVRVWAGQFDQATPLLQLAAEQAAVEPSDFAASLGPALRAVALLASGDAAGAARAAHRALGHAEASGIGETPHLAAAHGVVARTARGAAAEAAAGRAVELARRSSDRTLIAHTLTAAGDVLAAGGDPHGLELLREARALVDRCPDPGLAAPDLARAELRHRAGAVAPVTAPVVEGLTDREVAVLRLLRSQLPLRGIADELYVSHNTVKTHCRSLYRKLGASDRRSAVHRARQLGLG